MSERSGSSPAPETLWELFRPPWRSGAGVRTNIKNGARGRCEWYRSGKVALRDALDLLAATTGETHTNVVLPAYIPSGLVAPIREAGYAPRFHRITPQLRPILPDVKQQLDEETLALISVNYFGIPQPDHEALQELTSSVGTALIEDNAHAALSRTADGTLLGTRGDLGFTSFRKTMPVRDGAALYPTNEAYQAGPFPRGGVRSAPTRNDARYLLGKLRTALRGGQHDQQRSPTTRRPQKALENRHDLYGRDPDTLYERAKGPMSWLSAQVLDHLHPDALVAAHRQGYGARRHGLADLDGARAVFGSLAPGVCPQAFPIVVEEWEPICRRLGVHRTALPRWPPLPAAVGTADRFHTAQYLADHLIPLPI